MADATGTEPAGAPISAAARSQLDKVATKPPVFLQLGRAMGQALSPILNNSAGVKSPIFKELGISEKTKDYVAPAAAAAMPAAESIAARRRRSAILSGSLNDEDDSASYVPKIGG